ncbi:MAG: Histidine kinase [Thermotogales bacterium 46_20]|nr:MAG: Histidine kinase [Thermotogales bacterium 46_20]
MRSGEEDNYMGLNTISDHILDILQNSMDSGAKHVELKVDEQPGEVFYFVVTDDGRGIEADKLRLVLDPFYTEKKKQKVFGLGLPLLKHAAENTGGSFSIESKPGEGTKVEAKFILSNIDCQPVGNLADVFLSALTMKDHVRVVIERVVGSEGYSIDSQELPNLLGDDYRSNPSKMKKLYSFLEEAERLSRRN